MKRTILFLKLSLLFVATIFGQNGYEESIKKCQSLGYLESQECMIGKEIPIFEATNYKGEKINNQSIEGKVAVINFWFIACPPCIGELDGLNMVVDNYKENEDIAFISFTTDNKKILEDDFFPNYELKFEIIPDSKKTIWEVFKNQWGFPTTIIVDKSGKIHKITSGGNSEPENASKKIYELLTESIDECLKK